MNIIVAVSKNAIIGNNNQMIWNIKEDTHFFQTMVHNQICIYGRKTFDHNLNLAHTRINIVITRQLKQNNEHTYYTTLDNVLNILSILKQQYHTKKIFILGGTDIYNYFLPISSLLYITKIDKEYEGNILFPEHNYVLLHESSHHTSIEENCKFKLQCFCNSKLKRIRQYFIYWRNLTNKSI
jgi:dihydrofolate reductase